MNIEGLSVDPFSVDNERHVAAALELEQAARAVDTPYMRPLTRTPYVGWLRHGWDGEVPDRWAVWDQGRLVAMVSVFFPRRENHHLAEVGITVHPDVRQRGYARHLFDHCVDHVRQHDGRRLLLAGTVDNPHSNAFAERLGFARASVEVLRRQDLTAVDWEEIENLHAKARAAASDYSLLRITGPVPADMIDEFATMSAAINDAPTDDLEIEDEVFDAQRVRDVETGVALREERLYRVIARRGEDGPLAGHTVVGVDGHQPVWGGQGDTSVVREHRGHRLGLLLKTAMMLWLRDAEPQLRWIETGNAASNAYMIAINEDLGYRVMGQHVEWQRPLEG